MGLGLLLTEGRIQLSPFTIVSFFVLQSAVWLAWLAAVVVNDCFDIRIDARTNANRPLPMKVLSVEMYQTLGWIFFGLSILFAMTISLKTGVFLMMYQMISWVYSAEPLRLKRFPVLGTFVAALASWLLVVMGFSLVSPNGSLEHLPAVLAWFFLLAFTFTLPMKDLKDIEGDRADSVWTIPVLFGELRAKQIIGASMWLAYILSVDAFREPRLIGPSFVCGALSCALVVWSHSSERGWLTFRKLPWWILSVVFIYGIFVAYCALTVASS
jgi:4-hydroxybenzoate polyprenyltransferase